MSKGQKYNPDWPDSAESRTERSRNRRYRLRAKLAAAGWSGESEFHTAIVNGVIDAPRKPEEVNEE